MTKLEIALSIIIIFQWAQIIYVSYQRTLDIKKKAPLPITKKIKQIIGLKSNAYVPHKDESRILDGEIGPNFE